MNCAKKDVYKASVQIERNGRKVVHSKTKFVIPMCNILPSKFTVKSTSCVSPLNNENCSSAVFRPTTQSKSKSCSKVNLDINTELKPNRMPFNDLSLNSQKDSENVIAVKRFSILKQNSTTLASSAKTAVIQKRKRSKSSTEEEKSKTSKRHPRSKSFTEDNDIFEDYQSGQFSTPVPSKIARRALPEPEDLIVTHENIDLTFLIHEFFQNISIPCPSPPPWEAKEFSFQISPILPNILTSVDTFITEQLFKSKRKPKIKKSYAVNYSQSDNSSFFDSGIPEYIENHFWHSLYIEDRQTLERGFLSRFNPNIENRTRIINWMFKVQGVMKLPDNEIYISIYIFDKVLAYLSLPLNMYQLVAATSIWVANKMENINSVQLSNLLSLCGNAYVQGQMCSMEQKILKILKFKLCISEPTFFVSYALRLLNLESNELARHCAHFVIDCFALHPDFSSTPGSSLSFAAINVALRAFHNKTSNFFEYVKDFGGIPDLTNIEMKIEKQMIIVRSSADKCEHLKTKYADIEKMEVFYRL